MSTAENLPEDPTPPRKEEFDFLAPERRQKFDLLIHLLANLDQPLFLSGPDGIGKSTMLHQLQIRALPGWKICLVEAKRDLSFEDLQHALAKGLGLEAFTEAGLRDRLDSLAGRDEIIVLVVDDAGCLMPGVLEALCRFALYCPELRVVAALRPDDIHVKGATDPWVLEEAHIIELPPLTEAQSQTYLQLIWSRLGKNLDPGGREAGEIYKISHGIPAEIRRYALDQAGKQPVQWHRALAKPVYLALTAVVLAVVGVIWWQQQLVEQHQPTASLSKPDKTVIVDEQASPVVEAASSAQAPVPEPILPSAMENGPETPVADEINGMPEQVSAAKGAVGAESVLSEPKPAGLEAESEPMRPSEEIPAGENLLSGQARQGARVADPSTLQPFPPSEEAGATDGTGLHDAAWLIKQPSSSFTFQLAAFDKLEDLRTFAARFHQLQPLAFYHKRHRGRDWYALVYGVYPSFRAAKEARERMPAGVKEPWLRRLRSVQKEIRIIPTP